MEEKSLLQVNQAGVIAETVKLAEDGSGDWIMRLYECKGSSISCGLDVGMPVAAAFETNMLEETTAELPHENGQIQLYFRPFQVRTIRIVRPVNPA